MPDALMQHRFFKIRVGAALAGSLSLFALADPAGAIATGPYTTNFVWDAAHRLLMEIGPDPDGAGSLKRPAKKYTYDAEGRLTKTEVGTATTADGSDFAVLVTPLTTTYDSTGAKVKEVTPTGVTQYSYDAGGRVICAALRMNTAVYGSLPADACTLSTQGSDGSDEIVKTAYDAAGQVMSITKGWGTADQSVYGTFTCSANGQVTMVRDGRSNPTEMEYDRFDRLVKMRYAPPGTVGAVNASTTDFEAYTYDEASNRPSVTRRGWTSGDPIVVSCYDALNREIKRFKSTSTSCTQTGTAVDVFIAYDLRGLTLSTLFQSSSGTGVTATYDKAGRQLTETTFSRQVGFSWDKASNRTRVTWPSTSPSYYVDYVYDGLNRVTQLKELGVGTGQQLLATYAFNDLSQRTTLTRGNGLVTTYGYDTTTKQLTSLQQNPTGTTYDQTWSFTWNAANGLKSRADASSAYRWTRPTSGSTATYDGLNRDAAIASISGGYDVRGNLTKDATRTLQYDLDNRLTSVTGGAGLTLTYDPLGRLASSTSGGVTTDYVYDGPNLIAEYSGSTVLRRYVHGSGTDEPLVWLEGSGTTDRRWLLTDAQGSVVAVTDSSGAVTDSYAYGPWGEPQGNSFSGSRFRYTGQIALQEAKLYYYKARVYDPLYGRFLQTDPIGSKDDINLYTYVRNDPVNSSDPTGLQCERATGKCPVVDRRARPDRGSAGRVQRNYERTYRYALAHPGEIFRLRTSVRGTDGVWRDTALSVTGAELAASLEQTDVYIDDQAQWALNSGGRLVWSRSWQGATTVDLKKGMFGGAVLSSGTRYVTSIGGQDAIQAPNLVSWHEMFWTTPAGTNVSKTYPGTDYGQNAAGNVHGTSRWGLPPTRDGFAYVMQRVFGGRENLW